MSPARIGVFGGSFDPVHNGHLRAAEAVRRRFGLDRVLLVPSRIPPHKAAAALAPAADRLRMVGLAVRGRARLVASPVEVEAGGTSYSIRTLRRLRRENPGARIVFILGADAFLEIETWREWRRLLAEFPVAVITRPGFSLRRARASVPEGFGALALAAPPGKRVRLRGAGPGPIYFAPIRALRLSATDIRRRLRAGRPIAGFVPRAVARYIRERGLYARRAPAGRHVRSRFAHAEE